MADDPEMEAAEQILGELFAEAVIFDATGERPEPAVAARTARAARQFLSSWEDDLGADYVAEYESWLDGQRRRLHDQARTDAYYQEVLRLLADDPWWTPADSPGN